MTCPKCGAEHNYNYCPECGADMHASEHVQRHQTPSPKKRHSCLPFFLILLGILFVGFITLGSLVFVNYMNDNEVTIEETIEDVVEDTVEQAVEETVNDMLEDTINEAEEIVTPEPTSEPTATEETGSENTTTPAQ